MKKPKYIIEAPKDEWTERLAQEIVSHDGNYSIPESYLTRPITRTVLTLKRIEDEKA